MFGRDDLATSVASEIAAVFGRKRGAPESEMRGRPPKLPHVARSTTQSTTPELYTGPDLTGLLPPELWIHILSLLDAGDVARTGCTCKLLRGYTADSHLWKCFCEREGWKPQCDVDSKIVVRKEPGGDHWLEYYRFCLSRWMELCPMPTLWHIPMELCPMPTLWHIPLGVRILCTHDDIVITDELDSVISIWRAGKVVNARFSPTFVLAAAYGDCNYVLLMSRRSGLSLRFSGEWDDPVDVGVGREYICVDVGRQVLVAGATDGSVFVWTWTNNRHLTGCSVNIHSVVDNRRWNAPKRPEITCVSISPDGRYVVAGTDSRNVFVWDVAALTVCNNIELNHHHRPSRVLFGCSSDIFVVYSALISLRIEDHKCCLDAFATIAGGTELWHREFDSKFGRAATYCDGDVLILDMDNIISVVSIRTGTIFRSFEYMFTLGKQNKIVLFGVDWEKERLAAYVQSTCPYNTNPVMANIDYYYFSSK